ncbi:MAG TPA: hypothetical protein VKS24_20370 [Bradyrhizobium sp.]|nr:hypothetical protein [Bradyrhizobium sp.]
MNGWLIGGGLMASFCAAGHANPGAKMFYQPLKSALTDRLLAGVLTGMWHLITVHFVLSAAALLFLGMHGQQQGVIWLVAAQFAGYAAIYLVISLRLGGVLKLFQWIPFAATAVLASAGALIYF